MKHQHFNFFFSISFKNWESIRFWNRTIDAFKVNSCKIFWRSPLVEISARNFYLIMPWTMHTLSFKTVIFFAFPSWFFVVSIIPSASNLFCILIGSSYVMVPYVCVRLLLCKGQLEHNDERLRPKSATGARHIDWCAEVWRTSVCMMIFC